MSDTAERRWILITGASRGIGAATARACAGPETGLILWATQESSLDSIAAECRALGSEVRAMGVNLLEPVSIEAAWASAIKRTGGKLHGLINNAGVWIERPIDPLQWYDWENAMTVNLRAPMRLSALASGVMGEGASIVFIASVASRKSYGGGANYCAAKFGLLGFAGALFEDLRERGIKVISILPGQVNTDMHKDEAGIVPERLIDPADVADAVTWAMSTPARVCPSEITLLPQRNSKPRK